MSIGKVDDGFLTNFDLTTNYDILGNPVIEDDKGQYGSNFYVL